MGISTEFYSNEIDINFIDVNAKSVWPFSTFVNRVLKFYPHFACSERLRKFPIKYGYLFVCMCWGLTSQSTIFQSCRDGATASWVINPYFRGVKCLAQGHNTAAVGFEPPTSRSGVRDPTTEPPRSPTDICTYAAEAWGSYLSNTDTVIIVAYAHFLGKRATCWDN